MLKFELITPEKVAISEEVYEAILPTTLGQIAVLPNHEPLITVLRPGVISLRKVKGDADAKMEHVATSGGFAEITGVSVKVMADSAERADDLDEMKILEAKEEAKKKMNVAKDDVSHADAVAALETALAQIKVRNLKHRHGSKATFDSN